jgi:cobalt/nickel transport system permease protein
MRHRARLGAFIAAGLMVACALAFFVSPAASSQPDGLNRVAIDEGIAANEKPHALQDAPTTRLSTGVAGLVGVAVTFALAGGLFVVVRKARTRRPDAGAA